MQTVLVIDDDPLLRIGVRTGLTRAGYRVVEAEDPPQGLALARQDRPDLILCDVVFPKGSGFDLLSAISDDLTIGSLPVVMMTGMTDPKYQRTGMEAGADDFLLKPFTSEELVSTVKARLHKHEQGARKLVESEELFNAISGSALDAIVMMDTTGRIKFWNPTAARMFGYASREAIDHPIQALIFPNQPADEVARRGLNLGPPSPGSAGGRRLELRARHRNGWEIPVELSLSGVKLRGEWHTVGMIRDLSSSKRAEEQLRQFSRAIQQCPTSIVITDAKGTIEYVNPRFCEVTGYMPDEVVGQNPRVLKSGEMPQETYRKMWAAIIRGEEWRGEFINRRRNGELFWEHASISGIVDDNGRITHYLAVKEDITERKATEAKLRENEEYQSSIFSAIQTGIVIVDAGTRRIVDLNPVAARLLGRTRQDLLGTSCVTQVCGETDGHCPTLDRQKFVTNVESVLRDASGNQIPILKTVVPVHLRGRPCLLETFVDITERKRSERERAAMEIQLRHAQKMESIGQLAAGIAHEINTPTQFVGDNLRFLSDAFSNLQSLLTISQALVKCEPGSPDLPGLQAQLARSMEDADLSYLLDEIPKALEQSLEGVGRVSRIVNAMKEFSHPGNDEKTPVDLNRALETTLTVSRNEWKYVADLVTDWDPQLPPVPCLPGEFNQVILNLIVNAAHAIADVCGDGSRGKGRITVSTRRKDSWAEIRVTDTGTGIPEKAQSRVFEPFFTTKGVGKGTGQGLAIAHSVIVEKHRGTIHFETTVGKGTTFVIRLPLQSTLPPARPEPHATTNPVRG